MKINKPDDCHGCVYYNCYGDYCAQKGLVCRFKSLEDIDEDFIRYFNDALTDYVNDVNKETEETE